MGLARRWKVALAITGLAAGTAGLAFGPVVRSRVADAGARYGATVEVGSVTPGWNAVRLGDVGVRFADAPSITVRLDEVSVAGVLFGERAVELRGGDVEAKAPVSVLLSEVAAVRARAGQPTSPGGGGPARSLSVSGLRGRWTPIEGSSEKVVVSGLAVDLSVAGAPSFTVESVQGASRGFEGTAGGLEVGFRRVDGTFRLARWTAREAFLDASGVEAGVVPVDSGATPTPVAPRAEGLPRVAAALAGLRGRLDVLGAQLDSFLAVDAEISVEGLSAKVRAHEQILSVGPGRFALRREGEAPRRLIVELARTVADEEAKRLALKLSVPYGDGAAAAPFVVETRGGPIPLAALGVREGDFGLVEPDRAWLEADATITLDDAQGTVGFEGDARVRGLSLRHGAIAEQPIRGLDLAFRGSVRANLDASRVSLARGELEVGALRASLRGEVQRRPGPPGKPEDWSVDLQWEVPLVACQSLLDAAPSGLLPLVSGSTMAGSLALKGTAKLDTAQLDKSYDVRWDAAVGCRMVAPRPQVAIERFLKPFKKSIYTPEGSIREAEFGPGTPDWTPGARITHLMEIAVVTAEDGRFARHGGFDHEAIRNSIRENIRARRFVRGASTISMQLAKNLYLPRDKTLSRKLEEAILTLYLEQVLTKEQMIELYLNVVEFGPMIYGIGPAAQHYFRTSPGALTVSQSFYLASILPSPRKQHFAAGGAVTGAWMNHLRRLMKYANHRGRLGDAELDEGLLEVPVFGSPSPIREAAPVLPGEEGEDVLRRHPWEDGEGDG